MRQIQTVLNHAEYALITKQNKTGFPDHILWLEDDLDKIVSVHIWQAK